MSIEVNDTTKIKKQKRALSQIRTQPEGNKKVFAGCLYTFKLLNI